MATTSLTLSAGGTQGTLNGSIGVTGSLAIDPGSAAGANITLANVIHNNTAAGSISKIGAGTLTLTGANSYTGGTTFAAGVLDVGSGGALGTTGTLAFTGGTLQYSGANTTDYSNRFSTGASQAYSVDTNGQAVTFATALTSSAGTLTKLGAGTLTLTAANTYTGATTISGGTLALSGAGSIANSASVTNNANFDISQAAGGVTVNQLSGAGTVVLGARTLTDVASGTATVSGLISGSGGLVKTGAGTLTLTAINTYAGTTAINAGTLVDSGILNLGSNHNAISSLGNGAVSIASGATLQVDNQTGGQLYLKGSSFTGAGTIAFTGNTGALTAVGYGGNGDVYIALSQGGLINVESGYVQGSSSSQGFWTNVAGTVVNQGSLNIASGTTFDGVEGVIYIDGLTGSGTLRGGYGTSGSTTIGTGNSNASFSGVIADSTNANSPLILIKTGTGNQTLTGADTYTGGTTISGGQISIANVAGLGTGAVTNNAVLLVNAPTGTVTNAIGGTGTLFVQNTNAANTLTLSGVLSGAQALNVSGGGTVSVTNTSNSRSGTTNISANTTLQGTTFTLSSGAITDNGTLAYNQSIAGTVANTIAGAGAVTFSGGGVFSLTNANTYTGGTTVSGASNLIVGGTSGNAAAPGASGAITGPITLSGNSNLYFSRTGNYVNTSAISGTGSSTVFARGTVELDGAITTTGGVAIDLASSNIILGATVSGSTTAADGGYGSAVALGQTGSAVTVNGSVQGGQYIGVRVTGAGDSVTNLVRSPTPARAAPIRSARRSRITRPAVR